MNCSDLEEAGVREWNEALSLVVRDQKLSREAHKFKDKGSMHLDINRWKVAWGKKPEQYRLKPYFMWSVDEMPVLPEEPCPKPDNAVSGDKHDPSADRRDKQARALRKKITRLNRRLEKLNKTLTTGEEVGGSCDEGNLATWRTLPEALRTELIAERSVLKEKLKRIASKPTTKNSQLDVNATDDVDKVGRRRKPRSKSTDVEENQPKCTGDGEPTKEKSGSKCNKNAGGSADRSKSEPSDSTVDKKLRKKRFYRKHSKKSAQDDEKPFEASGEKNVATGKRASSALELSKGACDQSERGQNCGEIKIIRELGGSGRGEHLAERRKHCSRTHDEHRVKHRKHVETVDNGKVDETKHSVRVSKHPEGFSEAENCHVKSRKAQATTRKVKHLSAALSLTRSEINVPTSLSNRVPSLQLDEMTN